MTRGKASVTAATSADVEARPSENRTNDAAKAASSPMDLSTCDGSIEPAEHADPLEAQMPSKSSPAISEMLSQPSTATEIVFASR